MDETLDEDIGDEVNGMNVINGRHLQSKESGGIFRPSNSSLLTDILDGRNLDRIGTSEHASASPHCINDGGIMVEELTLRNYNGKALATVGTLGNKERVQTKPTKWQNLYKLGGGSASGSSHEAAASKDKFRESSGVWEDEGDTLFTDFLNQNRKPTSENRNVVVENLQNNDDKTVSNNMLLTSGGIRTKILSKSGKSEYFIKSTLNGKGIIYKGPIPRVSACESQGQIHQEGAKATFPAAPQGSGADTHTSSQGITGAGHNVHSNVYQDGMSLREWLKAGRNKLNKAECLYIFKQIVDLVDCSHTRGITLQDFRPSFFKLLRSDQVVYLGASVHTELTEDTIDQSVPLSEYNQNEKRPFGKSISSIGPIVKQKKLSDAMDLNKKWPQFPLRSGHRSASANTKLDHGQPQGFRDESIDGHNPKMEPKSLINYSLPQLSTMSKPSLTSMSSMLEEKWYTSPEQFNEGGCRSSSNIYCLGVLLFELLSSFDCGRSHAAAMLDLRHRILPSGFLSAHPKEAGFCLWLLHPELSSRPTTREILQSELIRGIKEFHGDELLPYIHEEDSESELLFYFIMSLKEQKQKNASKLVEELKCIETDIQEVQRRQSRKTPFSSLPNESLFLWGNRYFHKGESSPDVHPKLSPVCENEMRLIKYIKQLERAYFSMRSTIQHSDNNVIVRRPGEIINNQENFVLTEKDTEKYRPKDRLGAFFDGLCKYARYSKFRVRGMLRNPDLSNSANVICSLSFDRDEDYLATGGVSKKIKIFEYHALFNDSVDVHYPVLEMSNTSKLSCICWNSYIRNYLATTDYDGVVKLWDATTGQAFSHFIEHNERAWSVDFSRVDPTKLASGSDDRLVKLWSINERNSLCTIRNNANVCCVQFSPDSSHFLACSSSDYKTYCYDLRNTSAPWCTLAGHEKAVSYAKFLDAETLISASTDNTLKIWDLNKTNSNGFSADACVLTLKGHTNEKNFVGLSVNDGYITCGSETNEVFAYYKSQPMPITSHNFGSVDPISGKETDDNNGQFVSSVCWRQKSNTVLAASSSGCIKLLEMI